MQKTVFLSLGFSSLTGSPRFLHFRSHTWRLSLLQMRLSVSHVAWWKSSFQGAEGFKVDHTGSDRRGLVTMASVPLKPRQDQQKLLCVLCLRLSLQLQRFHTWPLNATGCQSFIYVFVPWTKFVYQCSCGPQAQYSMNRLTVQLFLPPWTIFREIQYITWPRRVCARWLSRFTWLIRPPAPVLV